MIDGFDEKWESSVELSRELDERLGLPEQDFESRKDRARELWEEGRLEFIGSLPVVASDEVSEE